MNFWNYKNKEKFKKRRKTASKFQSSSKKEEKTQTISSNFPNYTPEKYDLLYFNIYKMKTS